MSDTVASSAELPEVAYPPAVSLHDAWPWAIFAAALLAALYFVGLDEGAASLIPGHAVHEWVHDGRHLLGFPCH
jgi:Probable cobalt transporter subunit (CbtB)